MLSGAVARFGKLGIFHTDPGAQFARDEHYSHSEGDAVGFGVSLPVQVRFEPKPGLSRAYNHALRTARGDVLAFTSGRSDRILQI